jgi:hypothetical protein
MKPTIVLVTAALFWLPARAIDVPASIENAHVEGRAGVLPVAALDEASRANAPAWIGWSVPAVPEARNVCCLTENFKHRGCSLADGNDSWGTTHDSDRTDPTEIYILVESKDGRPSRVRIVSPTCPVDGARQRLVWLGPVDPGASLAALGRLLDGGSNHDEIGEPALAAIAYHLDARADALLGKRAFDRSLAKEARQQAVFWAGNARGEAGYRLIERVLSSEPVGDLREHALFALTQSSVPGAADRIKRAAVEDRDDDVRAQALFWLSQTKTQGAGEWIYGRLDAERDDHVREQAVFALSQLDDGTDWLIKILRAKRDPETVRHAQFWLGQSNDPRALQELEKILEK